MRMIDHVRKTVYIIVGCLTIVSLVFTLCHKVVHCENATFQPPFTVVPGDYSNVANKLDTFEFNNFDDTKVHLYYIMRLESPVTVNNKVFTHAVTCVTPSFQPSSASGHRLRFDKYTSGSYAKELTNFTSTTANANIVYYFEYNPNTSSVYLFNVSQSSILINIDDLSYYTTTSSYHAYTYNYLVSPGYVSTPSGYSYVPFYADDDYFNLYVSGYIPDPGPQPHSKGGVLANYIDSDVLIEQDSSLPTVDTTSPADPSSNSGWFQKILNGLSKINQSIKGGVLTIGDFIGQGFENVINWLSEPFDQEAFSDELNQISLINDLSSLKTLVENCGMFDWSDVTPAQSLSFTFDFGGAVLPHTSCVIDFSWYTGTVKNLCVGVLCTFLVIGLLVTIINQLPNIIGGKSGDRGGGSDS